MQRQTPAGRAGLSAVRIWREKQAASLQIQLNYMGLFINSTWTREDAELTFYINSLSGLQYQHLACVTNVSSN